VQDPARRQDRQAVRRCASWFAFVIKAESIAPALGEADGGRALDEVSEAGWMRSWIASYHNPGAL
jgi:hypothetical protein